MFSRLVSRLGETQTLTDNDAMHDGEIQLACATLLFSVLPVDYLVTAEEGRALRVSLTTLFSLPPEKCHRLMARAAAARSRSTSILAAATLLKLRAPQTFRHRLLHEVAVLARADGVLHVNEVELAQRMARLLGLASEGMLRKSA